MENADRLIPAPIWRYKGSFLFIVLVTVTIGALWAEVFPPAPEEARFEQRWAFEHRRPLQAPALQRQLETVRFFQRLADDLGYQFNDSMSRLQPGGLWYLHRAADGTGSLVVQAESHYELNNFWIAADEYAQKHSAMMLPEPIAFVGEKSMTHRLRDGGIHTFSDAVLVSFLFGCILGTAFACLADRFRLAQRLLGTLARRR